MGVLTQLGETMGFFQDGKIVLVILSEFPATAGEVFGFGHLLFLEDNLH